MSRLLLLIAAVATSGCFIPAPLTLEADGGGSTAPQVSEELTNPALGTSFSFDKTAANETPKTKPFSIVVFDPDSWSAYARLFIDGYPYIQYVESGSDNRCSQTPGCSINMEIVGLCDKPVNGVLGPHFIEAVVADQEWDDTSSKDLRRTIPGGFTTTVSWRFDCTEPVPTP